MSASNTPPNQKRTIFLQAVRSMVECIWTSSFLPEFNYAPANREKGGSYREITACARFRVYSTAAMFEDSTAACQDQKPARSSIKKVQIVRKPAIFSGEIWGRSSLLTQGVHFP